MSNSFEATAPGRLDVMGGIADYSGSLVLQMPISELTTVKLTLRNDFRCTIQSETQSGISLRAVLDYRALLNEGRVDYDFACKQFKKNPADAWTAYVLGCMLVLQREKNIDFTGADIVITSAVPLGKGVSSSASLEVATMKAMVKAFDLSLPGTELPRLAQQVENLIVAAPCGLMDQLTSCFGEHRKLLPIICQPDRLAEPIALPLGISFMGIDSGIRHAVSGSSYSEVRCAAFMGYSLIAQSLGVGDSDIVNAINSSDFSSLPFGGYLCNISPAEFGKQFKALLPALMEGSEFLSRHSRTIDSVTKVNKDASYRVYECTAHPIHENDRVHRFQEHLLNLHRNPGPAATLEIINKMGLLMYESHESYSRCGLGSPRTDEIVELVREMNLPEIAGAKITGGGSGGTVCLLAVGQSGKSAVRALHRQIEKKYGTSLCLFDN